MNEIAKEFGREIYLLPKLMFMSEAERQKNHSNTNKVLRIKVRNYEVGYDYFWSLEKFHERYYEIKDLWESYL